MIKKQLVILFILIVSQGLSAQGDLPLHSGVAKLQPLNSLTDDVLAAQLERELAKRPEWRALIAGKKMAVGLVDLRDPGNVRYAGINGDHMMYAASLPKIAVLLSTMETLEEGKLKETPGIRKDMRLMISKSDNAASTRLIDRVGFERIEAVMTDPKYAFYDENKGGGLWVGKRYGKGGITNREPLKNLSHAATASQVCRFYYLLAHGKLVNEQRSRQMLRIMENPELHHKFVNTLNLIAPNARLFRKSGSWKTYHSDSILVWGNDRNRRYILVALVDDPNGEEIIRNLVKPVEKVLKNSLPLAMK
jgi:beta-lactamase class A